jgi:hypothetical protein
MGEESEGKMRGKIMLKRKGRISGRDKLDSTWSTRPNLLKDTFWDFCHDQNEVI